jgi:hypothetical protein
MKLLINIILVFLFSSCTYTKISSFDHRSPALNANFKEEIDYSKLKSSTSDCVESINANGSISVVETAKKAGIKRILFVDSKTIQKTSFNPLGIFILMPIMPSIEQCITVHGY